ncbi:hypothetical protein EYR40_008399 [Pleurotus pulmonarius]|nr:hypothetical protein EYR40_008399 [Pleurotus pulmonarius]
MTFEFTHEMGVISNRLWAVPSAVGAGLCFLVLLVIAAVGIHPRSRSYLDRVSFRIVVYALFANMIFGIASAVGGTETGPGFICGFSIFILQLTLQFSSCLLFFIALNLQLVVVHGWNGQQMEKYYLMVSAFISVALTVPPYAAHQYGWDPLERVCWYTNDDKHERVIWQMTTQMGWTAFTVIGEVVCSAVVLIYMMRHNARSRRVFVPVQTISDTSSSPAVLHANRHRHIIFRIALYPVASCCVNLLSVVTALHSTLSGGIHDRTDYNILLLSDILYGGRAIVYALLAITDPALVRGMRALYSYLRYGSDATSSSGTKSEGSTFSRPGQIKRPEVFVELSTILSPPEATGKGDSGEANPTGTMTDSKADHPDRQQRFASDVDLPSNGENKESPSNYDEEAARRDTSPGLQSRMREARRKDKAEQDAFTKQI